jgi:hypothetical protein
MIEENHRKKIKLVLSRVKHHQICIVIYTIVMQVGLQLNFLDANCVASKKIQLQMRLQLGKTHPHC